MKKGFDRRAFLQIFIIAAVFWIADFLMHASGVGESSYYYISKLANAALFAILWVLAFNYREHWKKVIFSLIFGTWISFYYLITSYGTGLVQWLGIDARYAAPPFVIGSSYLTPYLWWVFHGLMFFIGLEIANLVEKKSK